MPRRVEQNFELNLSHTELPINKEDFQLIWLDSSLGKSADTRATQKMLRILNTNAQFYTDVEKCVELIQSIKTEHILLVVSGSLARIILPKIYNIRSVRVIFIFCEKHQLHEDLLHEYPLKVTDVYTGWLNRNLLLTSISDTMQLIEKQDMFFRVFNQKQKSTRDLTKESASFLWNRLLIDVLRKMPADDRAKNEMLDHCTTYYRYNKEELKKIEDFRRFYTPNEAIKYYTADSFLYKLLNKALRTEDIGLLYTFRFFIIDLCAQLEQKKEQSIESEPLTLYRGQQIMKEEFENLQSTNYERGNLQKNTGALIAINGFLSTSRNERISLQFSNLRVADDNTIPMQVTIKADPTLKTVTFADISDHSEYRLEQEVLFSLGTVFMIDACEFDETRSIGKLTLTGTDAGSTTLQSYLDLQKDQLQVYSPLIYFGRLLMNEMNEIDRAEEYFQMLLNTLPDDHPVIADVYNQIGAVHYMKSNTTNYMKHIRLNDALQMFEKGLKIRQNIYGHNDIRIAMSMNNIGSVYNDRGEYNRALDYYRRALQILEDIKDEVNLFKADLVRNMGILQSRTGDDEMALSSWIKADEMYSQLLPAHHPTHIKTTLDIANLCKEMNDLDRALKYYQRAYENCKVLLLPSEQKFKDTWAHVIRCCLTLGNKEEAIIYFNSVLEICERVSPDMQETVSDYVWSMAELCENVLDFEMALDFYKTLFRSSTLGQNDFWPLLLKTQAGSLSEFSAKPLEQRIQILKFRIKVYEKIFPNNDLQHSFFLTEMGEALEEHNSTDAALRLYQKAFKIHEASSMLLDMDAFWNCWTRLVDIYFTKKDEQSVINVLKRASKKCKQVLSNNHHSVIPFLRYIGYKYKDNNDTSNAFCYFDKAFTCAETTKSYNDIRSLLTIILELCIRNGKEQTIPTYIQRTVNICEKDCIELSNCYLMLGKWYRYEGISNKASQYFEQFLLATEVNDLSSIEILDRMWIDFVLSHHAQSFPYERVSSSLILLALLTTLMALCELCLPPCHLKYAIVRWQTAVLLENLERMTEAVDRYRNAIAIFEKHIHNQNNSRAKQALHYLLSQSMDNSNFLDWLKGNNYTINYSVFFDGLGSPLLFPPAMFNSGNDHDKWKCILERLRILKVDHIDSQWEFHLRIESSVLDDRLCNILMDRMFHVCDEKTHSDEKKTQLDIDSMLCCLEFISHWYFVRDQFLESLLYRQRQLELESKIFYQHPYVGWSLWFIGLIFQKRNEYDFSIGYLNRALKIFECFHLKEHDDIRKLEEHILQTRQAMHTVDAPQIVKPFMNTMIGSELIKCNMNQSNPYLLQTSFHID